MESMTDNKLKFRLFDKPCPLLLKEDICEFMSIVVSDNNVPLDKFLQTLEGKNFVFDRFSATFERGNFLIQIEGECRLFNTSQLKEDWRGYGSLELIRLLVGLVSEGLSVKSFAELALFPYAIIHREMSYEHLCFLVMGDRVLDLECSYENGGPIKRDSLLFWLNEIAMANSGDYRQEKRLAELQLNWESWLRTHSHGVVHNRMIENLKKAS